MPSTAGYMLVSVGLSFALFLSIWFLLRTDGDEAPWLPAGPAPGLVIPTAAAARRVGRRGGAGGGGASRGMPAHCPTSFLVAGPYAAR